ncbi:MAG TPA: polysaccharide deacetylase family protein [Roseiflexaceae bacterium]|nr:polysaccharide deacetylase family protein [Roseiflexaceae bacterium]
MATSFTWPNSIQCAVSLTYDDGLPIHYTLVGPALQRLGLLATFYPMVQSDLIWHADSWRGLAQAGHELGNHSLFHPCRQTDTGQYPWLDQAVHQQVIEWLAQQHSIWTAPFGTIAHYIKLHTDVPGEQIT